MWPPGGGTPQQHGTWLPPVSPVPGRRLSVNLLPNRLPHLTPTYTNKETLVMERKPHHSTGVHTPEWGRGGEGRGKVIQKKLNTAEKR